MNKTELIDGVAGAADLTKAEAGRAVDAVIAEITKALKKGEAVTLVGFGTFQVRERAARTGRALAGPCLHDLHGRPKRVQNTVQK